MAHIRLNIIHMASLHTSVFFGYGCGVPVLVSVIKHIQNPLNRAVVKILKFSHRPSLPFRILNLKFKNIFAYVIFIPSTILNGKTINSQ